MVLVHFTPLPVDASCPGVGGTVNAMGGCISESRYNTAERKTGCAVRDKEISCICMTHQRATTIMSNSRK